MTATAPPMAMQATRPTFGLLIQKHYVAPLDFILVDRPHCVQIPSLKCAHILFWLNPTGHSKLYNTLHTLRLLPTSVGLLVLPCTRQCPRSSATSSPPTPARDRRALHQLALNVHVKHSDPDLDTTITANNWHSCLNYSSLCKF